MAREEWPSEYYGIQLLPPLVYCPTHKRWEGYDESIKGLCDYCCLESPCPLGHTAVLEDWPVDREEEEAERVWRERLERRRHKTGETRRAESDDETIVMDFLDWS